MRKHILDITKYFLLPLVFTIAVTAGFYYMTIYSRILKSIPDFGDFEVLIFLSFIPIFVLLVMGGTIKKRKWILIDGDFIEDVSMLCGMWIMVIGLVSDCMLWYAYMYRIYGVKDTISGGIVHDGSTALYFTIVTWTTLGYGDILPVISGTRVIAAAEAMTGYVMMTVLIATLVTQFEAITRSPNEPNS